MSEFVFKLCVYIVYCFILKSGREECGNVSHRARAAARPAVSRPTVPRGGAGHVTERLRGTLAMLIHSVEHQTPLCLIGD